MPFCPKCKYEYEEGIVVCPDCGVELVQTLTPEESHLTNPTVVGLPDDEMEANMLKSYLESKGIEAFIYDPTPSVNYGIRNYKGKLLVAKKNFEEAEKLLEEYLENIKPLEDEDESNY